MPNKNERALKMLAKALEIEESGKAFYDDAIKNCQNELGKEIFTTLMQDELIHIDRILNIYESLKNEKGWTDEWEGMQSDHRDVKDLFKDISNKLGKNIKAHSSDLEALDVGIDFEWKTVVFYEEYLPSATDPLEKYFVERMVAEEKKHYNVLKDMKQYLSDPSAWFVENEHHAMDAG
ncbi:MAG: ferritin family protein [Pseudomonadota bacterium]